MKCGNMKITTIKENLKQMDPDELKVKIDSFRRELFALKLNSASSGVKDHTQFKKLKKDIAQIC